LIEFSGVVTQINYRLGGSTTVLVQPVLVDYGILMPEVWFEMDRLELGDKKQIKPLKGLS